MKKCAIFIPYFQKLLPWQKLLFKTIQWNPDFDFILLNFSEIEIENELKVNNLHSIKLTEHEFFERIEKKLGINVKNKNKYQIPKKYNDYSITFGAIFDDIIKNYSLWGIMSPNTLIPNLNRILINYEINDAEIFIPPCPNGTFYIFRNITVLNYLFSRIGNIDSKLSNLTSYDSLAELYKIIRISFDIKTKIVNEQINTVNIKYPFSFIVGEKGINNSDNFILEFSDVNTGDNINYLLENKFTIENQKIYKLKLN